MLCMEQRQSLVSVGLIITIYQVKNILGGMSSVLKIYLIKVNGHDLFIHCTNMNSAFLTCNGRTGRKPYGSLSTI